MTKIYCFYLRMILLDCKKVQDYNFWILILHTWYLKQNVQMINFCSFKMTTFRNFLKKAKKKKKKKSNSRQESIFQEILIIHFSGQKRSWKNMSKIAFLVNYQKHIHRYFYFGWCSSEMAELGLSLYFCGISTYSDYCMIFLSIYRC